MSDRTSDSKYQAACTMFESSIGLAPLEPPKELATTDPFRFTDEIKKLSTWASKEGFIEDTEKAALETELQQYLASSEARQFFSSVGGKMLWRLLYPTIAKWALEFK